MSLCVPMTQVLLHAIIDDLREDNKVFKMGQETAKKWYKKASSWTTIARVGLPVTYAVVALAIVVPGILNKLAETNDANAI